MPEYITTTTIIIGNNEKPTARKTVVTLSAKHAEPYLMHGWLKPYKPVERKVEKTPYQSKEEKSVSQIDTKFRKRKRASRKSKSHETVWEGNLSDIHEYKK